MNTIKNNYQNNITIKNSKFICYLYKINSLSDIKNTINDIKSIHKDATHYCYAYVFENQKKSSDDGEPSGTAGIPMLKVLDNFNLTNVLVIIVRYFGGIKLGANGLIRAYTKSVTSTITKENIVSLSKGLNVTISFNYNRVKEIDYLLKNIKINTKKFDNNIIYNIDIEPSFLTTIISNNIDYEIIKDIDIEK